MTYHIYYTYDIHIYINLETANNSCVQGGKPGGSRKGTQERFHCIFEIFSILYYVTISCNQN